MCRRVLELDSMVEGYEFTDRTQETEKETLIKAKECPFRHCSFSFQTPQTKTKRNGPHV